MVYGDVEADRELVFHAISLYGFHPHFDDLGFAPVLLQGICHFRSHGGDDVAPALEHCLHEGVVFRGNESPCSIGVSLPGIDDFALEVKSKSLLRLPHAWDRESMIMVPYPALSAVLMASVYLSGVNGASMVQTS